VYQLFKKNGIVLVFIKSLEIFWGIMKIFYLIFVFLTVDGSGVAGYVGPRTYKTYVVSLASLEAVAPPGGRSLFAGVEKNCEYNNQQPARPADCVSLGTDLHG
jgi:hypothetical protein